MTFAKDSRVGVLSFWRMMIAKMYMVGIESRGVMPVERLLDLAGLLANLEEV